MAAAPFKTLRAVRIVHADAPDASAIVDEVCAPAWAADATLLKRGARSSVCVGPAGGREVVVKRHELIGLRDRIARVLGATRLRRQRRGAVLLRGAGVATAAPVALARAVAGDGSAVELLVLERAPGPNLLERMFEGPRTPRAAHALGRAVGAQVARLARAGLVNRDHKPSNLIVADPGAEPVIVDTVGVRRARGDAARRRTLFALVVEPVGAGVATTPGDRMRVAIAANAGDRAAARADYRAVAATLRAHGDPTPKDDPLARLRAETKER